MHFDCLKNLLGLTHLLQFQVPMAVNKGNDGAPGCEATNVSIKPVVSIIRLRRFLPTY